MARERTTGATGSVGGDRGADVVLDLLPTRRASRSRATIAVTTSERSLGEVTALLGEPSFGHDRDAPLNPRKPHGDTFGRTSGLLRRLADLAIEVDFSVR